MATIHTELPEDRQGHHGEYLEYVEILNKANNKTGG